jgi:hypothetical protein
MWADVAHYRCQLDMGYEKEGGERGTYKVCHENEPRMLIVALFLLTPTANAYKSNP